MPSLASLLYVFPDLTESAFFRMSSNVWSRMEIFERWLFLYFLLLGILWLWKVEWSEWKQKKTGKQRDKKDGAPQLMVSKAAYVREVLSWCRQHLGEPAKGVRVPELKISYYPHRKRHGVYYSAGKAIRIYVNNHPGIAHLTDTILHEYVHFLEIRTHVQQKEYDHHIRQVGYDSNPYEVSARRKAAAHVRACLSDMKSRGFVR
ncbi:MAG: hypothetical protein ACK46Z_10745 [Bacteroidota bacterium]|jgi:hypothetical protein